MMVYWQAYTRRLEVLARGREMGTARQPTDANDRNLQELAALFKVVAHPVRLAILESLLTGVKCVKQLNAPISVSQPNLSQHMSALRRAGLVDCESRGPLRCYYLLRPSLVEHLLETKPARHSTKPRSRESVLTELNASAQQDI
jgi:ArsR family transcriptional regulator